MEKLHQIIEERIERCRKAIEDNKKILDDMDTDIMNLYIDCQLAEDTEEMCRLENELNGKKCLYRQRKAEFEEKTGKLNKEIGKLEMLKDRK